MLGVVLVWPALKIERYARVAELVDAPDLGSGGEIRRGSSPLSGNTMIDLSVWSGETRSAVVKRTIDHNRF